ncbi:ankyrin repeat domain-containing protein 49-like [Uloborus diversus]|uniref:ankyrin repeat domain-containing protein 49-like n=1 Tax=Uloborus diversus TaxID=327109 RepID=UPI002409AB55|nr:ankyrin repeat domain-containing protein 49-like [Uloborus diversus]
MSEETNLEEIKDVKICEDSEPIVDSDLNKKNHVEVNSDKGVEQKDGDVDYSVQNSTDGEHLESPAKTAEDESEDKLSPSENFEEAEELKEENEKERQLSIEDKSQQSNWSYSQWSENYESIEDERPVEDFSGDPKKEILWAAEKNELETLRRLLEEDSDLVNVRDNDLYTPLHRACYSNNVDVIKVLLSYDADISAKTVDGWEPLHCACKWDSVEAVSLLLQNGADVNAQTKGHITPLHLAASNVAGRRTLELLLWQPFIDPNIKNDAGDTAYDIACRTGPLGALFEILEESLNVY